MILRRRILGLTLGLDGDHPRLMDFAAQLPTAERNSPMTLQMTIATLVGQTPPPIVQQISSHLMLTGSFGYLTADRVSGRGLALLAGNASVAQLSEALLPLFGWLASGHDRELEQGWLLISGERAALLHGLADVDARALTRAALAFGLQAGLTHGFRDSHGRLWVLTQEEPLLVVLEALAQRVPGARSSLSAQAAGGGRRVMEIGDPAAAIALLDHHINA